MGMIGCVHSPETELKTHLHGSLEDKDSGPFHSGAAGGICFEVPSRTSLVPFLPVAGSTLVPRLDPSPATL